MRIANSFGQMEQEMRLEMSCILMRSHLLDYDIIKPLCGNQQITINDLPLDGFTYSEKCLHSKVFGVIGTHYFQENDYCELIQTAGGTVVDRNCALSAAATGNLFALVVGQNLTIAEWKRLGKLPAVVPLIDEHVLINALNCLGVSHQAQLGIQHEWMQQAHAIAKEYFYKDVNDYDEEDEDDDDDYDDLSDEFYDENDYVDG